MLPLLGTSVLQAAPSWGVGRAQLHACEGGGRILVLFQVLVVRHEVHEAQRCRVVAMDPQAVEAYYHRLAQGHGLLGAVAWATAVVLRAYTVAAAAAGIAAVSVVGAGQL